MIGLLDNSAFSPRIVKGLHDKKYYIREVDADRVPVSDTPSDESVAETALVSAPEMSETPETAAVAQEPQAERPAADAQEEAEIETLTLKSLRRGMLLAQKRLKKPLCRRRQKQQMKAKIMKNISIRLIPSSRQKCLQSKSFER